MTDDNSTTVFVATESDGSRWVSFEDYHALRNERGAAMSKPFLQLVYSLCKQYVSWYELEIKNKVVV